MNIFLRWGIIVKIYPSTNLHKFQDNKDLYTLCKSDGAEKRDDVLVDEPVYEQISKSTNDLINRNSINAIPNRLNRSSIYRSFGKSTYNQFNQIQSTIKKTTSTIIKSTNHNVIKLTNQTLNRLNNRSGANLIRKLNSNLNGRPTNSSVRRSTSVLNKNVSINRPFTRSFSSQQEKENLVVNRKFERNYRGHSNRSVNGQPNGCSIANSSISTAEQPKILTKNLSSSFNGSLRSSNDQFVSLNPMNDDLCLKCVETEGSNLIRFLTKLSDGLKKKPLKPVNTSSAGNSLSSSINSNSKIVLNRDQVHYIPNLQSFNQPINRRPINYPIMHQPNHFNGHCLTNPISSTCYNTLV